MADYFVRTPGGTPGSGSHRGNWAASTTYALGDVVYDPAVQDQWIFVCTTAGTSGASAPAWDKSVSNTTADNSVVWTANFPTSWELATSTVERADALLSGSADRLFLDSTLVDTYSSATITLTFVSDPDSPAQIISATAGSSPPTYAAGATIKTTGARNIEVVGSVYAKGVTFIPGNAAFTNADFAGPVGNTYDAVQIYEECYFDIANGSSADFQVAQSSNSRQQWMTLINSTIRWRNVSSTILVLGPFTMRGGGFDTAGSLVTNPVQFLATSQDNPAKFYGVDFSRMSASATIVSAASTESAIAEFYNCLFPASFTGTFASTTDYSRVAFYDCLFGSARRILYIQTLAGTISDETTVLKVGGASDGYVPISWEMTCAFEADEFTNPLYTDWISVFVDGTGSKTIKFDTVIDDGLYGAGYTDRQLWLEVQYMGTASSRRYSYATDKRASSLVTPTLQPTSSATWTGTSGFVGSPLTQEVAVTINVEEEGVVMCRIGFSAPFFTVYVDPKPTVT